MADVDGFLIGRNTFVAEFKQIISAVDGHKFVPIKCNDIA